MSNNEDTDLMNQKRQKNIMFLVILAGVAIASYVGIILNVAVSN